MRSILGLVLAAFAASATSAHAAPYYVEGSAGVTTQEELEWGGLDYEVDDGWNAALAVGTTVWGAWDAEVEFSYDEMEYTGFNKNNTNQFRLMGNLTRNFDVGAFSLYAGGGLGVSWVTYENFTFNYERSDTVPAYQLIGGGRIPVGGAWSLFGEYRYQGLFEMAKDANLEWDYNGHNFAIGARLNLQ